MSQFREKRLWLTIRGKGADIYRSHDARAQAQEGLQHACARAK